jgi:hypothetical protein
MQSMFLVGSTGANKQTSDLGMALMSPCPLSSRLQAAMTSSKECSPLVSGKEVWIIWVSALYKPQYTSRLKENLTNFIMSPHSIGYRDNTRFILLPAWYFKLVCSGEGFFFQTLSLKHDYMLLIC